MKSETINGSLMKQSCKNPAHTTIQNNPKPAQKYKRTVKQ